MEWCLRQLRAQADKLGARGQRASEAQNGKRGSGASGLKGYKTVPVSERHKGY